MSWITMDSMARERIADLRRDADEQRLAARLRRPRRARRHWAALEEPTLLVRERIQHRAAI